MSWRSASGRYYKPNVFDQNFSWYKDKPSDDPMLKQDASQQPPQQLPQTPEIQTPGLSMQTAAPNYASGAGKRRNAAWLLLLVAVLAATLFVLFSR